MTAQTRKCNIHTYCKFCKALGIKRVATRMSRYAPQLSMRHPYKHYSCDEHVDLIEDTDPDRTRRLSNAQPKPVCKDEDTRLTEADYQTWWKL